MGTGIKPKSCNKEFINFRFKYNNQKCEISTNSVLVSFA